MIINAQSILINKVMTEHDAATGECLRDSVRQREIVEGSRTLNRTEKQAQNSNFSKLNEFLKHKISGLGFLKDDI